MFASDAEVNIVIVTVSYPDGSHVVVKAYRDDARQLREFCTVFTIVKSGD